MKKNKLFWILTVVCVLNFAAHLYFYPSLPDIVPTHWGANGQVNGWGPKSTVLILAALPFAMLILLEVIRKIDPKHQNFEKFGKVWNLFVVLFTVMMAAFSWLSDLAVFGKLPDSSNLVSILVCGGIGVHRYYVGKIGTGILYTLTLSLFGIGCLVDLIKIATGKFTDKDGNYIQKQP